MNAKFNKNIEKASQQLKYKTLDEVFLSLTKWAEDEQVKDYDELLNLCSYYQYDFLNISFIDAVKNNNPHIFNDILILYNRINIKHKIKISDGSAGLSHFNYVLEAFAGNDLGIVEQIYPKNKQGFLGKQKAFPQAVSNLLLGILQHNKTIIEKGKEDAKRCLNSKNGNFEIALIQYLLALVNKDMKQVTVHLSELIKYYRRARWIHDFKNPLSKMIPLYIYGLYNLARYCLNPSDFSQIEISKNNDLIWDEFCQIATSGKPSPIFTGRLTPLNKLYE